MSIEAAHLTKEVGLRLSIIGRTVTTPATSPGSIAGVNEDYRDSGVLRFVRDFSPEIVECPTSKYATELPSETVSSFSNAFEVFEAECL